MRKYILILIIGLGLVACSGNPCSGDKEAYLERFNNLMKETSSLRASLDDPVWEDYDEQFRVMVEECYDIHEDALTGGEKRRFWFKAMGYYKDRYGKAALDQWIWGKKASK